MMVGVLALATAGCASTGSDEKNSANEGIGTLQQKLIAEGDKSLYQGEVETALMQYMEAARFGDNIELWTRVGHTHGRLGQAANAVQAYEKVLELDSDYKLAYQALGEIYLGNRKSELAATAFERAIALDDGMWRSHNGLAVAADLAGDYPKAQAHYERALAIETGSASLWTNFGYSHYLRGDYDEAKRCFEKALTIDSGHKSAWANLGLLAARSGDYGRALDLLTKIRPQHIAYNDIGYIALLSGDLDQAEQLLTRATELSPSYYTPAHENLKLLHLERDKRDLLRLSPTQANGRAPRSQPAPGKTTKPVAAVQPESPLPGARETSIGKPAISSSEALGLTKRPTGTEEQLQTSGGLSPAPSKVLVPPEFGAPDKGSTTAAIELPTLTLADCENSSWPSACRLCVLTSDPNICLNESLESLWSDDKATPKR